MKNREDMTDEELYQDITGEELPAFLKRQADLGPEVVPFDTKKPESVEVDGVKIPAWLCAAIL